MKMELFCKTIKEALDSYQGKNGQVKKFLFDVNKIEKNIEEQPIVNMTNLTILFEGFYRSLEDNSDLKNIFTLLRTKRWSDHFGTPTLFFLLSYQQEIEKTSQEYKNINTVEEKKSTISPWTINKTSKENDEKNHLLIDAKSSNKTVLPEREEKAGEFLKTYNPSGGFTTSACDPYSLKFIELAASTTKTGGQVLEIGAAFGAATLQALFKGATVYCNDIEPQNLAVVKSRYMKEMKLNKNSTSGDHDKLILLPGAFPEELNGLPESSFDAILICRVLHFFSGKKIEKSLSLIQKLLKPGGKFFVVCETPFLKNWQKFTFEHEKRLKAGVEWPGEITNPADFESSGRASTLPSFVHWISKEILEKTLKKAGFFVSDISYINRKGQFPDDLLLNGQESVGAIGIKEMKA